MLSATDEAVRDNPSHASSLALLGYKYGWDGLIQTANQGLEIRAAVTSLQARKGEPVSVDVINKMTQGLLAFLDMPTLRRMLQEYVAWAKEGSTNFYLKRWLNSGSNSADVHDMLARMPADGLALYPFPDADCWTYVKLNETGEWTADDLKLNQTMQSKGGDDILNAEGRLNWPWKLDQQEGAESDKEYRRMGKREDFLVWPYFWGAKSILTNALGENGARDAGALEMLARTTQRMQAAIEPLYRPIGSNSAEVTLWRGLRAGHYPELDALAAAGQYTQLAQALIPMLRTMMVATSKSERVAKETFAKRKGRFLQGILIRLTGTCRGIETNEVLKEQWKCFATEQEVVIAPNQHYEVHPDTKDVLTPEDMRRVEYHQIHLRVADSLNPKNYSAWVYGDDPHWQQRDMMGMAPPHSPGLV